jgi:hypothetical protein
MNFETAGRNGRRKLFAFDAELDALVAREVDALSARRPAPARRRQQPPENAEMLAPGASAESRETADVDRQRASGSGRRADPAAGRPRQTEDNVVGIRRADADQMVDVRFSADEETFIEQALAFLKGRENADVVIEELWAHAVLDRNDRTDEPIENLPEDFADKTSGDGTDAERASPPSTDPPARTQPHQVTAIHSSGAGKSASQAASVPPDAERKHGDGPGPKPGSAPQQS